MPPWDSRKSAKPLQRCYRSCLNLMINNNLRSIVRSISLKKIQFLHKRHSLASALVPVSSREAMPVRWHCALWGRSWTGRGTRWTGSSSASTWLKISSSTSKECRSCSHVHDSQLVRKHRKPQVCEAYNNQPPPCLPTIFSTPVSKFLLELIKNKLHIT